MTPPFQSESDAGDATLHNIRHYATQTDNQLENQQDASAQFGHQTKDYETLQPFGDCSQVRASQISGATSNAPEPPEVDTAAAASRGTRRGYAAGSVSIASSDEVLTRTASNQSGPLPSPLFQIQNKLRDFAAALLDAVILLGFFILKILHWMRATTKRGAAKVQRTLQYLADEQGREPLAYYADDLGLAWNVLLAAWRGQQHPYEYAFVRKYGKSPEKLIPVWQARNAEQVAFSDRPPKKQPESVSADKTAAKKAGA